MLPQRTPRTKHPDDVQAVPPPPEIIRRLLAALDNWEPQQRRAS